MTARVSGFTARLLQQPEARKNTTSRCPTCTTWGERAQTERSEGATAATDQGEREGDRFGKERDLERWGRGERRVEKGEEEDLNLGTDGGFQKERIEREDTGFDFELPCP
jgi:hypothetical protein